MLRVLPFVLMISLTSSKLYAQGCNCTSIHLNGSFEAPNISKNYKIMSQDLVPSWSTTASDRKIELWYTGFNGVPAALGNQFSELNANRVGHIYQALCMAPGTQFTWAVYHRGRSGVDVATIGFGSDINAAVVQETMSDGNSAWGYYSGSYTVPAGQDTTYVIITSVSSAGSNSYGNFIDGFDLTVTYDPCVDGDGDGDGVPDTSDDYPNDPARAFNNYFPSSGKGTLMFEDLWPWKGDYDFNDVVVDYQFTTVTDASNSIVETFADFTLRASGAGYENGFGFQLPNNNIADADINVTGYDLREGNIVVGANGLEAGQNKPTIVVFDNFFNLMPRAGGIGVNTQQGQTYVAPVDLQIVMTYTPNTYTLADLNIGNFNPFIYIDQNRAREVHLPNYEPTALADQSMLGSGEDDSKPGSGRYYKASDELPWALNVLQSIPYPIEKVEILNAYSQFDDWAQSGGLQHTDWYLDQGQNREEINLY